MRILIVNDIKGSPDGKTVKSFLANEEYEVGTALMSEVLAECLLDGGNAQIMKASSKPKEDVVLDVPTTATSLNGG